MVEDHRYLTIEIAVEQVDQHPRRLTIGQRCEPAHIGQPDRGVDLFDITAPDPPGEDALAGVMPDIGIEKNARHPPQSSDLGDRASGVIIASIPAICASVKPPGSRVVQVTT